MLGVGVSGLALGMGLTQPSLNSLISRRAGREEQGEVLGVSQSVGSLSRVIGPALAGLLFSDLGREQPVFVGGGAGRRGLSAGVQPAPRARGGAARRGRADEPGRMSRRGRPVAPGPAAAKRPAQGRAARAQGALPLSVAARIGGVAVAGRARNRVSDRRRGSSTSRCRSSTSTRSTRWRRARRSSPCRWR